VRLSEQNIETCKTWPKVKDSNLAHAYYNAGLANILINDNAKAMSYLVESEKLKGGDIVSETIAQAQKSAQLEAEMRRVEQKTEAFEQSRDATKAAGNQAASSTATPAASKAATESVEDRLQKIEGLYKKGFITKQEYDAKKAEILKDI
jgi:hypothetical protein